MNTKNFFSNTIAPCLAFVLLIFAGSIFSTPTFAADINLSWNDATQREDGSAITGVKEYRLYSQVDNGATTVTNIPGVDNSFVVSDVPTGVHTFQISTVEDGLEGTKSDVLSVNVTDIAAAAPGKMLNFSFTFSCSGANCSQEVQQ